MFERAIDEILIRLGHTVLILAAPDITRTEEQKAALEKSVNQFAVCASSSQDERVTALRLPARGRREFSRAGPAALGSEARSAQYGTA